MARTRKREAMEAGIGPRDGVFDRDLGGEGGAAGGSHRPGNWWEGRRVGLSV